MLTVGVTVEIAPAHQVLSQPLEKWPVGAGPVRVLSGQSFNVHHDAVRVHLFIESGLQHDLLRHTEIEGGKRNMVVHAIT